MSEDNYDFDFYDENKDQIFWEDLFGDSIFTINLPPVQAQVFERMYRRFKVAEQELSVFLAAVAKAHGLEDPRGSWDALFDKNGKVVGVMRIRKDKG